MAQKKNGLGKRIAALKATEARLKREDAAVPRDSHVIAIAMVRGEKAGLRRKRKDARRIARKAQRSARVRARG